MAVKDKIRELADKYAHELKERMASRVDEMENDDKSHYLLYRVLGITDEEGELIDIYQNKGRFLYKYAGAFLEEATFLCFKEKFPRAKKVQIENTLGRRPKQFEIDCLVDKDALEIKWRDATTDGDHITKEHTRIQAIKGHGYKPIRVMFYYPNREQAIRIQATLKTVYEGVGGEYYGGDEAWSYVYKRTKVDLKGILAEIAEANVSRRKR
jgi:type II restriction enzyme